MALVAGYGGWPKLMSVLMTLVITSLLFTGKTLLESLFACKPGPFQQFNDQNKLKPRSVRIEYFAG